MTRELLRIVVAGAAIAALAACSGSPTSPVAPTPASVQAGPHPSLSGYNVVAGRACEPSPDDPDCVEVGS